MGEHAEVATAHVPNGVLLGARCGVGTRIVIATTSMSLSTDDPWIKIIPIARSFPSHDMIKINRDKKLENVVGSGGVHEHGLGFLLVGGILVRVDTTRGGHAVGPMEDEEGIGEHVRKGIVERVDGPRSRAKEPRASLSHRLVPSRESRWIVIMSMCEPSVVGLQRSLGLRVFFKVFFAVANRGGLLLS
uniref:Uncharacterized protein n=1 Tax=Oryza meridionalis TaxID=40149 RepID=A0A0E0D350_9ORYZ